MTTLAGRTLLMSGGSRGIGLAIATRAAQDGANIVLLAKTAQPHPRLEGTIHTAAAQIEAAGGQARVVVLRSEGRAFSFGGDVGAFATADDREQMVDDLAETLHRTISDLHRMDAVVVSAVQGMAAGAGVPLAAVADVVLAGASARFTLAYTKIGLSPDGGSSLLSASLGLHRALHLALLNPILTAQQASRGRGRIRRQTSAGLPQRRTLSRGAQHEQDEVEIPPHVERRDAHAGRKHLATARTAPARRHRDAPGRHLGAGSSAVAANGIGGNIEMWEALALRLPGRQLIMIDMPGTGGSPANPAVTIGRLERRTLRVHIHSSATS